MRNRPKERPKYITLIMLGTSFLLATVAVMSVVTASLEKGQETKIICQSNFFSSQFSSKSDVVFMFATHISSQAKLAIKSLRSTGTKARIILFTQVNFAPGGADIDFLNQHMVELQDKAWAPYNMPFYASVVRFNCEFEWLNNHISEVRRILHADAFDVFYQRDPFENSVPEDKIVFVLEPVSIRKEKTIFSSMCDCLGSEKAIEMELNYTVSSSLIAGSSLHYFRFLLLITHIPEWGKCYGKDFDKVAINYLVWSDILKKNDVNYSYTGCESGLMLAGWCLAASSVIINEYGELLSPSGRPPSCVAKYSEVERLERYFFSSCSMKRFDYMSL